MDQRVIDFLAFAREKGFEATEGTVLRKLIMQIANK